MLRFLLLISVLSTGVSNANGAKPQADYKFRGTISREVLQNYLSRAVTHAGLLASSADPTTKSFDDDLRMLTEIGAKFVGRAAFVWDLPADDEAHFQLVKKSAARVHQADADIVLQACIFEIVTSNVNRIAIPAWAFKALGMPVEQRTFRYKAMLYDNGRHHNRWRGGASVPDMSKPETQLWFYYRARRYLDCGIEAIHFGQVLLMDDADPKHRSWQALLQRIRAYARKNARRDLVLCDAHTHGIVEDGQLLFDFHSYPLRIREVAGKPTQAKLAADQDGDIVGRSLGGVAPSGWQCKSLPYLVEFDNYGYSGRGGQSVGDIWVWGYDEISWFAHQKRDERKRWLRYAHDWVRSQDSNGHLQMPTRRLLAAPVRGIRMYSANNASEACPDGFGVEAAIKSIWRAE